MRELAVPVLVASGRARAVAALLAAVAARPAVAQHLPVLVPTTVPSFRVAARAWPDSEREQRETHWLAGAVIGTTVMGSVGALLGAGFCSPGGSCLDELVKGFLFGASIGFPLGGILGDAISRSPAPSNEEGAEHAVRANQPQGQADPVLRLLEPARRR